MFNAELNRAVESFAAVMFPLTERDLEREWVWKDHDEEGIRFTFFVTIQELRVLAVALSSPQTPLTPAQQILGQYHAQYMDLQAAIFSLSESDADRVPAEGEWQVRRVYSHMLGADIGFSAVVRYALEKHRARHWTPDRMSEEDEIRVTGMGEEKYDALMQGSFEDMRAFHRDFHPKIIQEFSTITDSELDLPSTFWEETRFPIRHRLHRFEAHMIQHTVQIDKTLAAINSGPSETKRLIRYLFAALAAVDVQLIAGDERSSRCSELAGIIESRTREIEKIIP